MIEHGHGIKNRFGGLPDAYSEASKAKIVLIPVPFDLTSTYKKGADRGPEALIEASRNLELYDIETRGEVYLKGIHTDQPLLAQDSVEMLDGLYQRVKNWLNLDKFIVSVGGEHSISYAAIRAHAEKYPNMTVLQFDAHADLQPAYENNPWSHASVMARVKEIPQVTKTISVGIRSMAEEEVEAIDQANTFFAHEISENPAWMNQVIERLTGSVYITFDLDVFDSCLMPSTGTPEPGGLGWNEVMKLLNRIAKERTVVGFDVVELCPIQNLHAPDYLAAKLVYKLLSFKYNR